MKKTKIKISLYAVQQKRDKDEEEKIDNLKSYKWNRDLQHQVGAKRRRKYPEILIDKMFYPKGILFYHSIN